MFCSLIVEEVSSCGERLFGLQGTYVVQRLPKDSFDVGVLFKVLVWRKLRDGDPCVCRPVPWLPPYVKKQTISFCSTPFACISQVLQIGPLWTSLRFGTSARRPSAHAYATASTISIILDDATPRDANRPFTSTSLLLPLATYGSTPHVHLHGYLCRGPDPRLQPYSKPTVPHDAEKAQFSCSHHAAPVVCHSLNSRPPCSLPTSKYVVVVSSSRGGRHQAVISRITYDQRVMWAIPGYPPPPEKRSPPPPK